MLVISAEFVCGGEMCMFMVEWYCGTQVKEEMQLLMQNTTAGEKKKKDNKNFEVGMNYILYDYTFWYFLS